MKSVYTSWIFVFSWRQYYNIYILCWFENTFFVCWLEISHFDPKTIFDTLHNVSVEMDDVMQSHKVSIRVVLFIFFDKLVILFAKTRNKENRQNEIEFSHQMVQKACIHIITLQVSSKCN